MNRVSAFLNYFNPLSNEFTKSINDFGELKLSRKIGAIAFTALGLLGFVVGSIGAFRWIVTKLTPTELTDEAKSTHSIGKAILTPNSNLTQGSKTQFDPSYSGKGRSACTYISLYAAKALLNVDDFLTIKSEDIDEIVDDGVAAFTGHDSHTSPDQVDISTFDIKFESFHFGLSNNFKEFINDVSEKPFPLAFVITKAPETIAVICRAPNDYWLFDSHGKTDTNAYVQRFESKELLCTVLSTKFSYMDLDDDAQNAAYNSFNAFTYVLK